MALDGAFLHFLKNELNDRLRDARVDKIYQPNSEEFIFLFRNKNGSTKVLFSARANSPRVHITEHVLENPETPPMLCMLFRKKLSGAKLLSVNQDKLERVLSFNFSARNELGDLTQMTLVIEIMGKYSNVILLDENAKIIDALKRVDVSMSSKRQILPGLKYSRPPKQDKRCLLTDNIELISEKILDFDDEKKLASAVLAVVQGVSPIVCRQLSFALTGNFDAKLRDFKDKSKLVECLTRLKNRIEDGDGVPFAIRRDGVLVDFSFEEIYLDECQSIERYSSFSELLDEFYLEKDTTERMKSKAQSLNKMLTNTSSRLERKIEAQRADILACEDRSHYKEIGDIINANLYRIEKGQSHVILENFYSDNMEKINIKLDPMLTAVQNAQKYYKEYRKSKTAKRVLDEEISKAIDEKSYIDAVIDAISRVQTEKELSDIREELVNEGYLKEKRTHKSRKSEFSPLEFRSSEGIKILVGKNNKQNDKLTLKVADKAYIWLHVKDLPGSHVIIMQDAEKVDSQTLLEAAQLAAFHSKAKDSSGVAVDYTEVKNVKKPSGAKPGMVIYSANKTVYVTPSVDVKNNLLIKTNVL